MQIKEAEFKKVIAENQNRLLSICRYYTHSDEDRNDLYQEILIKIWQCLGSFKGDSSIHTWAYKVALNTSISYANKEIRRMNFTMRWDEQKVKLFAESDGFESNIKEKQLTILSNQLDQLNVIDKAIMLLVLEDIPTKEIAEIIGITEPNVRVKIHRVKNEIKMKL